MSIAGPPGVDSTAGAARAPLWRRVASLDPEAGCPNFFEKDAQYTYKRIPIFDNRGEDILQYMDQAIAFIEQVRVGAGRW